jgi:hypothetical protein
MGENGENEIDLIDASLFAFCSHARVMNVLQRCHPCGPNSEICF